MVANAVGLLVRVDTRNKDIGKEKKYIYIVKSNSEKERKIVKQKVKSSSKEKNVLSESKMQNIQDELHC